MAPLPSYYSFVVQRRPVQHRIVLADSAWKLSCTRPTLVTFLFLFLRIACRCRHLLELDLFSRGSTGFAGFVRTPSHLPSLQCIKRPSVILSWQNIVFAFFWSIRNLQMIISFCRGDFFPDALPGLCPWTPMGNFRPRLADKLGAPFPKRPNPAAAMDPPVFSTNQSMCTPPLSAYSSDLSELSTL